MADPKRAIKGIVDAMCVEPGEEVGNISNYDVTRIECIAGIVRCLLKTPIRVFVRVHSSVGIRSEPIGMNDIVSNWDATRFELFAGFV